MRGSKRSWKAKNQAAATMTASASSCGSRCLLIGKRTRLPGRGHTDGVSDGGHDLLLLLRGDARPERHREVLGCRSLRLREIAFAVAERAQRRLEVERRLVVLAARDARLGERRPDAIPLGRAADVEVVDVAGLV